MSETIVFFGSGPVAADCLRLLARDFQIEAVVTKPQPSHHKAQFPVLAAAEDLGLPILTTEDNKQLLELFASKPLKSRLGVVIDYGIIIPQAVIDYYPLGIVNSHFSLLPKLRGADPISFAILNGDKETGVSLMLIVEGLDEGPILTQKSMQLPADITTPQLTEQLIELSHDLLLETLPKYVSGKIKPKPQAANGVTYSRKLTKEDSHIDWTKPAIQIEREIRAFTGWPRSRTKLGSTRVIITAAHVVKDSGKPGELKTESKQLGVYCGQDLLIIDKLIPAGKKGMPAEAFLAGYKI